MIKILKNPISLAAFSVALTVFGGFLGYLATDYFDFISEKRAEIRREYVEAQTAAEKLLGQLQSFSDQALGKKSVTGEEKEAFRKSVRELFQSAKQISQLVPAVDPEFDAYAIAMLDLQKAALGMTGPTDANWFIETFSRFLKAHNEFDRKVRAIQKDYTATLL